MGAYSYGRAGMSEFKSVNIRLACEFTGWSLRELSARANVSYGRLRDIANGRLELDEQTARLCATACSLPLTFFIINHINPSEQDMLICSLD